MAVGEIPYKVTIAIFSYMESSTSRSEMRGNFFPLENHVSHVWKQQIVCSWV